MRTIKVWSALFLLGQAAMGLVGMVSVNPAQALPGQRVEEVTTWIRSNPTLRSSGKDKLLVQRSDTAAQRFIFQASVLPPGKVAPSSDPGFIRTERLSLFDIVNGVTSDRLIESLRNIYGSEIYQDFVRGEAIYAYPTGNIAAQSRNRATPLLEALQGELRVGDRYAYWVEIARNKKGVNYAGQIVILLKSDVDKIATELRSRTQ